MPHHDIPMVSATEFAAISAAVDALFGPRATKAVFARHGFSRRLLFDPSLQLPNSEYMRFLEACARVTGEPLLGARVGDSVSFSDLGLYGRYVTSAPDLAVALSRASRALKYHETGSRLVSEIEGGSIRVSYTPPTPRAIGSWHQSDGVAAMLINLVRSYAGPEWKPSRVEVAAAIGERRTRLQRFFGIEVRTRTFGTVLEGRVDAALRLDRVRRPAFSWGEVREMVSGRPPETFANTLRNLIDPLLRTGVFGLEDIAGRVGLGPRTIQRRLAKEGTAFGAVLEGARRDLAEELLSTTSWPLAEIAPLLGYSSKQHFIRAFRRWSGQTPAEFRKSTPRFQRS